MPIHGALAGLILSLLALSVAWLTSGNRKVHPKEPRVVPPWIPFVGHMLGMARHGGGYIKRLGSVIPEPANLEAPGAPYFPVLSYPGEPILTLPVLRSRIYLVMEPSIAAAVQRNTKTLSFSPMLPDITRRVLGLDQCTIEVVSQNLDPEPGEARGFLADVHDWVHSSFGPGQSMITLSCAASQELCDQLHTQVLSFQEKTSTEAVDLLDWIRHLVTIGTANFLFGKKNPLAHDRDLEKAFWAFDHGLGGLFMDIFPRYTASEAYFGRERLVAALRDYLEAGYLETASEIVQGRARIEREYGMSLDMSARSALSFLFAGIVNTTTTTFWIVLNLFAHRQLLDRVRKEVALALEASVQQAGPNMISIGLVKEKCPTLEAVYKECLRMNSENFSVRMVKEDALLAERYFLKKGAVVQISGGVMHSDPLIWGDDVDKFNPDRFLGQKSRSEGYHPAAFRGFGGGKTLCPGRDFATNEILLFAAVIIHTIDLAASDGGQIRVPKKNDRKMPVHILEPKAGESPRVMVQARAEAASLGELRVVM